MKLLVSLFLVLFTVFGFAATNDVQANRFILRDPNSIFKINLIPPTLAASYTLTMPPDVGLLNQVLATDGTGTLTWISAAGGPSFPDNTFYIFDNVDPTIQLHFDVAGTTGTQTTVQTSQTVNQISIIPDTAGVTDTFVMENLAQTLTNKTIDTSLNTILGPVLTHAGYDATGELHQVDGWSWLNNITDYLGAGINATIAATVTDYNVMTDTTQVDGQSINTFRGILLNNLVGNTTATSVNFSSGFQDAKTYAANATPNNIQGFADSTNYQAGPASNSHISHWAALTIDRNINSVQGFIAQESVGSVSASTLNNVTDFGAFPVFGPNATIGNYNGIQLSPSFNAVGSLTNYSGLSMNPTLNAVGFNSWRTFTANAGIGQISATDINNWIDLQIFPTFGAFADLTSGYTGFSLGPSFQTGSLSGGVIQLLQFNPQIDIAALPGFSHASFNSQLGTNSATTITNFYGMNINDNYGANLTLGSVTGIAYRPSVTAGASVTGNWTGFDTGINATLPVGGTAIGMNIDMSNAQTTTQKVGVQVNDGMNTFYSNYDTSIYSATPGFMQQHALGGQFHVAAGSPMSVTLSTGINAGLVNVFEDDMGPDAFGGFIGRADYFGSSQMSIAATKTVDTYNNALFATSIPVTGISGGTLTNGNTITVGGFFPQGVDTFSITNLKGINILPIFNTLGATNAWGIFVDDSTVDNYFSKSISINTASKKSAAGIGLEIYNKSLYMDLGPIIMTDPSASGFKTQINPATLTADTQFTLPPNNGTAGFALLTDGSGNTSWGAVLSTPSFADNLFNIYDNVDNTKIAQFQLANQTTGLTRTTTMPDYDGTMVSDPAWTTGSVLFKGTTYVTEDNTNFFWDDTNDVLKLRNSKFEFGSVDSFARRQIWNYDTNAVLRLGSWGQDGDALNSSSEGIVVYGDSLTGQPISGTDGGYARVKQDRFGLFTVDSTLPAYVGGDYYFRADNNSMYYKDDSAVKTFEVTRTSGNITTPGTYVGNGSITSKTSLVLEDPGAGTNTVTIQSGVPTASYVLTLPVDDGAANQVLKTDGSGVLSWTNQAAGTTVLAVTTKTANYTIAATDDLIVCDTSSNDVTLTLPTAVGNDGKVFHIKKISSNFSCILDGNAAETIDDELTQTLVPLHTNLTVVSDGANWLVL